MKIWCNNVLESVKGEPFKVSGGRVRIGRNRDNDIVLDSPFVPEEAAILYRSNAEGTEWELMSLGLGSVQHDGKPLARGEKIKIGRDQTIKIFPFTLTIDPPERRIDSEDQVRARLDEELGEFLKASHLELLERMDLDAGTSTRAMTKPYLLSIERNLDEIARLKGLFQPRSKKLLNHIAGQSVRTRVLRKLIDEESSGPSAIWLQDQDQMELLSAVPDRETELDTTADYVLEKLAVRKNTDPSERMRIVERGFWKFWTGLHSHLFHEFIDYLALRYIKREIKDIVFGYGPLEDLLKTPMVTEIMVVDRNHIYVERGGIVENSGRRFISDEVTQTIIERIVSKVGRRIDKSKPLVDARLIDGSRVNAVIPPLAVSGPCLTVRKFPARKLLIEDLVEKGSLTRTVAEFLRAAVLNRRNILISGGTGTGKTTLLNCLSDFIPDHERIVTIEDTAELQLKKEHVVRLETKPANVEGTGAYTIRDLVKNALRMRPDRIVVGECRGPEALDMLQAMNTGHDGSLTTVHANTSQDVMLRLEVLVQMAADLPTSSIRRQIVSAVDLVVQLTRMRDGSRRVSQVTELVDMDAATGEIQLKDLFLMSEQGDQNQLTPTGRLPTFMGELIEKKMIELDMFYL